MKPKVWPEDTGGLSTYRAKEAVEKQLDELAKEVALHNYSAGYSVQQDLGFIVVELKLIIGAKGWKPPPGAVEALAEKQAKAVVRKAERAREAEKERKRLANLEHQSTRKTKLPPKKKRASKAKKKKAR